MNLTPCQFLELFRRFQGSEDYIIQCELQNEYNRLRMNEYILNDQEKLQLIDLERYIAYTTCYEDDKMNLYEDFIQFCEDRKYEFPCEEEKFYFRAMVFVDDVYFCPEDYTCHDKLSAHLFIMREGQKRNDFILSTKVW